MYIRATKKQRSKTSKVFYQYSLAQTYRLDGKVKQRSLLYLGSEKLMDDKNVRDQVLGLLKLKIQGTQMIIQESMSAEAQRLAEHYYEKYLLKYKSKPEQGASMPPAPKRTDNHTVDLNSTQVEDARTFGAEHLSSQVMEKLGLEEHLKTIGWSEANAKLASISIASRAIFSSSEYKTSRLLASNSSLLECYNYDSKVSHKKLYDISDALFEHRESIDKYLYDRICTMFDLEDKLVIFDISNTYFETGKRDSDLAAYGRSKEKRYDCPIVVFTGVINKEGFVRHSKAYKGNTPDVSTLEDMLDDLEANSNKSSDKTIVIDAGISTEENLSMIASRGYKYVCVSRKRLKDYPISDTAKTVRQLTDRQNNKVELSIFKSEGYDDTWMYVQSEAKRKKEESMQTKLCANFEQELDNVKKALHKKGGTKRLEKVWERIGRIKQRHKYVSGRYEIKVDSEIKKNKPYATQLIWARKNTEVQEDKTKGVYFIRTNHEHKNETQLWNIYNTIREVEATFRCLKSDLQIRPIYHQNDKRIKSHIYLTTLAYQLTNTIRHMLKKEQINHSWTEIVRIMNTQKIQTVVYATQTKDIHQRLPSKPIQQAQQIYHATNCADTQKAKKKYVVYH